MIGFIFQQRSLPSHAADGTDAGCAMCGRISIFVTVLLVTCCAGWTFGQSAGGVLPFTGVASTEPLSPSVGAAWTSGWTNLGVDFLELPYNNSRGVNGLPNAKQLAFKYRTQGVWISLAVPLRMANTVAFRGEAGVLIPATNREGEQFVDNNTHNPGFPYAYTLAISTQSRWWTVDGRAELNLTGYGTIIGGVRWDYFDTHVFDLPALTLLVNPTLPPAFQFGIQVSAPGMEGDILLKSLAPYVGVESTYGVPYNFVTARAIGFPWMRTWLDAKETQGGFAYGPGPAPDPNGNISDRYTLDMRSNQGFFYELALEYKTTGLWGAQLGAFAKWTQYYALFDGAVDLSTYRVVPPPDAPDVGGAFPAPSVSMNRRFYTIGATLSFPFNLPI